ncbi:uncharacterized protein V1518DRAFT_409807 [Limtongia smithiae]|uniref:uncharacterized protein n=1 Tax=Limtongia smithiae TaxID=1125753 RepID=UPI0034CDC0D0
MPPRTSLLRASSGGGQPQHQHQQQRQQQQHQQQQQQQQHQQQQLLLQQQQQQQRQSAVAVGTHSLLGIQNVPNGPQAYARQPLYAQASTQAVAQVYNAHFPAHITGQVPAQQLQSAQAASAAVSSQRRNLSSPFPVPLHGPTTPGTPTGSTVSSPRSLLSGTTRDDNSLKIYYMSPPKDLSPLIKGRPDSGYPDYFPWSGKHTEDLLSDSFIQHGFEDKPFLSHETGSAYQFIQGALKDSDSLEALSSFMMTTLKKRVEISRIMPPTTFKPPPRVTLTDQKREAWLRDLASPQVPLRKLSRTIPHGIRNRVLVEQCCSKAVPIHRAVWFARCVGANELRGLKRKGNNSTTVDAESQWIKEWTVQLIAYIEKIATECGQSTDCATPKPVPQQKWRTRMDYVVRFAAHLYSEDLIDRNYFLSWVISQCDKCSPERLPLSLLFVGLFWTQLTSAPSKSRKLAVVLLNHMEKLSAEVDSGVAGPQSGHYKILQIKVAKRLWDLLNASSVTAFLLPENWHAVRAILLKAIQVAGIDTIAGDRALEAVALANMTSRSLNAQLSSYSRSGNAASGANDTGATATGGGGSEDERIARLERVLDGYASTPYDVGQLADELVLAAGMPRACFDGKDSEHLVAALCRWALSTTENGDEATSLEGTEGSESSNGISNPVDRIGIVTGVLERWSASGRPPLFDALFAFFDQCLRGLTPPQRKKLRRLIQQIVRTDIISPHLYMRKVIARGIFLPSAEHKDKQRCHSFILLCLPLEECAPALQNQRNILLRNVPSHSDNDDDEDEDEKDEESEAKAVGNE